MEAPIAPNPEKIAVLGSNSFSGSHFVAYALGQGAEVIGISRSAQPSPAFLPYSWSANGPPQHFAFHQLDLNRDLDAIMEALHGFRPDRVVNFAAQSMVAESWQNPDHWMMTNVVSMVRLHERLRRLPGLRTYVHVSTPEVYGSCQGLIAEHTAYNPSTPYATSRAAADMSLMSYFRNHGFPVVFTRAANVYGPGQQLYRIIPRAILFFLTGRKLQLHGGGHSIRSFIHIRDVAEATFLAACKGTPGSIYHLSTPRSLSIRQLVEMIAGRLGVPFESSVEVVEDRPGKDPSYLLDSSKALRELGWQSRIDLEEGIDQTLAWVRDNLDELLEQPLDYIHKP